LCGIYQHQLLHPTNELLRGFDPIFAAPHSRYGIIAKEQYESVEGIQVLASSEQSGVYISASKDKRIVFLTGHPEYDPNTLKQEFERDSKAGLSPALPLDYFQDNDPSRPPVVNWRGHGNLLFNNWLNYFVYQTTPYDLDDLHS
jgi:homoserine O-succinyltransferase